MTVFHVKDILSVWNPLMLLVIHSFIVNGIIVKKIFACEHLMCVSMISMTHYKCASQQLNPMLTLCTWKTIHFLPLYFRAAPNFQPSIKFQADKQTNKSAWKHGLYYKQPTLFHWVTCSSITTNSMSHTLAHSWKQTPANALFCPVWVIFAKK